MLKSWIQILNPTQKTTLTIVVFLVLGSFLKAGFYTIHYGGTDLRDRVVASRMLNSGRVVYFYKWTSGATERLLNPNVDREREVNGVTASPGSLYIQSVFSILNYPILRIAWTLFQYLLCIYIFYFFLSRENTHPKDKFYVFAVGSLFFLCSQIWLINIERGQIYILYAFFFCLLYQFYTSHNKLANCCAGIIIAIAIYSRPLFIVMLIPLFIAINRWTFIGLAGSTIALTVHAYLHEDLWKGYISAMTYYTGFGNATTPIIENNKINYPGIIEGANNLTLYKKDFICGGISPLNTRINSLFNIGSNYFYLILYLLIITVITSLFRNKLHKKNSAEIILFGFLLYIIAEFIMPAQRGAYHLIQWIFPVLVFLQKPRFSPQTFVFLITGLCFINAIPFYIPFIFDIGELLLVYCLIKYINNDLYSNLKSQVL